MKKPEIGIFFTPKTEDLLVRYFSLHDFIIELQKNDATSAEVVKNSDIYIQLTQLNQVANSKQRPIISKLLQNQTFENSELDNLINQPSAKFNRVLTEPLNVTELHEGNSYDTRPLATFMLHNTTSHYNYNAIAQVTVAIDNQKQSVDAYALPVKGGLYTLMQIRDSFIFQENAAEVRCDGMQFGSSVTKLSCLCKAKN